MIHRTRDENSVSAIKYDKAAMDNFYVYDILRMREAYNYDYLEYLYDTEMTCVIVCVVKDGKCIAIMAYNYKKNCNLKVYKILGIAYNLFKDFEFICLLENSLSLKWCLRFSKRRGMKVSYDHDRGLINFKKEE